MPDPIRVLLVDTPTLSRRCLAALLNRKRHLQVVGEAATASQALVQVRSLQPDLAVVEPAVAEDGLQLVADLCQEIAGGAVLVLTLGDSSPSRALQAGARGYLQKQCEPEDLVRAIERVHTGELVVAAEFADTIVRDLDAGQSGGAVAAGLTPRELAVLQLVVQGRTNQEIAYELCITEHTVKGHVAKILRKLELDNRVQLASFATHHRLFGPTDAEEAV